MSRSWKPMAWWFLLSGVWGCTNITGPDVWHPGSAQSQQRRAERFDPYVDNDIGPAVLGGRPPGYEEPIPETQRSRWNTRPWWNTVQL